MNWLAATPSDPQAPPFGPLATVATAERRRSRTERRHSQRFPFVVAVRQQVIGDAMLAVGHGVHLAQSSDLGMGGMRIWRRCDRTEPALPMHTPLQLIFELPDGGELLELRGEVVFDEVYSHSETFRATGVRFSELSAESAERLQGFLLQASRG